jgi:ABC-type lipoprotein release transport system permease subunit
MAEVDTPPLGSGKVTFDSSAFKQVKGSVQPVVLEGRTARGADEIALGTETMRRLHTRVGETIDVRITALDTPPRPMRVVGRIVVAPQSDTGRLGTGAFIDLSAAPRLAPPDVQIPPPSDVVIRFAPGVDRDRAVAALQKRLGPEISVVTPQRPADLVNFGHVQNLPLLLGALIGLLGAATLAHTLVTSIRQRRRDLSVLMTLGFSSRQVRAAVATQASVFVTAAAVIALPVGAAAGRLAWRALAERLGTIPDAVTPSLLLLATIPVAIVLANLIAFVPGAIAGRLRPALVLRRD